MQKQDLIGYLENFSINELPSNVIKQVKICLYDYIASGYGGCNGEASSIAWNYAKKVFSGVENLSIFGDRGPLSLLGAVYYNSVCATDLDIDDGIRIAAGHPGGVIFPASISLAQQLGSDGNLFIEAIVLGYELGIRAGQVLQKQSTERFFGAGAWASIGAAVSCGWLLGLKPDQLLESLGIAEAYAPLSPVLKSIANGGMVKESMPWGAISGINAAYLSLYGFKGVESVIFEEQDTPDLGYNFYIKQIFFKRYPCCRWTHPMIDAILKFKEQHHLSEQQISHINVYLHGKAMTLANYEPTTLYHAEYSIPFTAAIAVIKGRVTQNEMCVSTLSDKKLLEFGKKVRMIHDPRLDQSFPEKNYSSVEIVLHDGTMLESGVLEAKGEWYYPLSEDDFNKKFETLTEGKISSEAQRSMRSFIFNLENEDMAQFVL